MKAIVIHNFGPPEVLKYEDVPDPVPRLGEIRVRIHAATVNRVLDVSLRAGKELRREPVLPLIPGVDCAGIVDAVGPGVTGYSPGERVAYVTPLGCYAAERNVPITAAVKLPDGISDEIAAAIMLKGMTVEYLLHRTFNRARQAQITQELAEIVGGAEALKG